MRKVCWLKASLSNLKACVISIPRPKRRQNGEFTRHTPLPPRPPPVSSNGVDPEFHPNNDRNSSVDPRTGLSSSGSSGPGLIGDGRVGNSMTKPHQHSCASSFNALWSHGFTVCSLARLSPHVEYSFFGRSPSSTSYCPSSAVWWPSPA